MSKEDNGGPAFPTNEGNYQHDWSDTGMTLRDYFAAKALPTCYAEACREFAITGFLEGWKVGVALESYAMADAMLEARKK